MGNEGKGRRKGGRKEEGQTPLSVTFPTQAHNLRSERQREEEREMRPAARGAEEIKEHYTSLLLKCSEQE